ncbi:MAG: EpsG family protein [Clostridia bacterium]|nr:EpsG family protein [Clostridia bacterium]
MNIYVVNIILTFLWAFLCFKVFKGSGESNQGKKIFCTLTTIQWILISGLRGMSVSMDMLSYKLRFEKTLHSHWWELFKNFELVYINGEGKDPGYAIFEKTVQIFTHDYQTFLFIVAIIFFTAMGVWVYKYSENPLLSMLIFDSFMSSFFAITGTRQTLATVLVVFIGGYFIRKRKLWQFLVVTFVAYTIHKSAICVLPFYFIANIEITRKYVAVCVGSIPILFIFKEQFFNVLGALAGYEYDDLESGGAYGFTLMYIAVLVVSILLLRHFKYISEDYKLYYNALFLGAIFLPLVFVNPAAMRVVQYYSLYLMLLIPQLVKCFERKLHGPISIAMIGAILLATNVYNYHYEFFWQ